MRKVFQLLVLLLILITNCYSILLSQQNSIKEIKFDFKNKKFDIESVDLESVIYGDYYRLIVSDINLNIYDVFLDKSDADISKPVAFPTLETLKMGDFEDIISSLSTKGGGKGPTISEPEISIKKDIIGRLINFKLALIALSQELSSFKERYDNVVFTYNDTLLFAQTETSSDESIAKFGRDNLKKLYHTIGSLRNEISIFQNKAVSSQKDFIDETNKYLDTINNNEKLKWLYQKIDEAYIVLFTIIDKAKDNLSGENTYKYMSSFIPLVNSSSNKFTSLPLQFSKEQATLKITIKPKREDLGLQTYNTELVFPLKKDWHFGVSTGYFVSFMRNDAISYQMAANGADTSYKVIEESPSKYEFGINALFHVSYNFWDSYSFTFPILVIGPGLAITDKVRPRLFTGLGLSFGTKHQLSLSGGFIMGMADRLSKVYNLNDSYKKKPEKVVVSSLESNYFISIGYMYDF